VGLGCVSLPLVLVLLLFLVQQQVDYCDCAEDDVVALRCVGSA
jgi:hypothetical protein